MFQLFIYSQLFKHKYGSNWTLLSKMKKSWCNSDDS